MLKVKNFDIMMSLVSFKQGNVKKCKKLMKTDEN